jgi:hypothetical protein
MAWDVMASAVRLVVVPHSSIDAAEDLVALQRQIEAALAAMPDATILDIHVEASAEGHNALIFYTEPEHPSRGMGFR